MGFARKNGRISIAMLVDRRVANLPFTNPTHRFFVGFSYINHVGWFMHVQAFDALDLAQACTKQAKCQRVLVAKIAPTMTPKPQQQVQTFSRLRSYLRLKKLHPAPMSRILPGMTMFRCKLTVQVRILQTGFKEWMREAPSGSG